MSESPATRFAGLLCPDCGYDLRGATGLRCTECGLDLSFIAEGRSIIPWERRRELGWLRAYLSTFWMVVARTRRFCRAACGPVSYRDARWFQFWTVLVVYVSWGGAMALAAIAGNNLFSQLAEHTAWWYPIVFAACLLLALFGLTGAPSYLFHPKRLSVRQQNRAVALSYYACAALALTPILLGVSSALKVVLATGFENREPWGTLIELIAGIAPFLVVIVYWIDLIHIAHRTQREDAGPKVALLAPLLCLAVATLALVILPSIVAWLAIVWYSL